MARLHLILGAVRHVEHVIQEGDLLIYSALGYQDQRGQELAHTEGLWSWCYDPTEQGDLAQACRERFVQALQLLGVSELGRQKFCRKSDELCFTYVLISLDQLAIAV
jgi:hypothetical protein